MKLMKHTGKIALLAAVIGILFVALMLFGARLGLWEPVTGFGLYRTYLNPVGAIIVIAGLLAVGVHLMRTEKSGVISGGIAALIGVVFLAPLIAGTLNPTPRAAPIHNISTDTANPPAFEVLDETRAGARNPLEYGGPDAAEAQKSRLSRHRAAANGSFFGCRLSTRSGSRTGDGMGDRRRRRGPAPV